jgi:predicted dehydrogenase
MTMLGGVELFRPRAAGAAESETLHGPPVNLAVVGLGVWGREILTTLTRVPEANIVAICDTYPAFLRRAGKFADKAEQVADYQKILDNKEIKAVFIATPTFKHRELAVAALQAGKHVYCEAPLATTIEDARAIALAAKNTPQLVFQAGLQNRSEPQRAFVLTFIRSGAIGKPLMARAQWFKKESWRQTAPNPDREKELNWRLDQATSLGLVGELGIHHIDCDSWFFNAQPVAASGFGAIRHWNDGRTVADTVQSIIEYPEGLTECWEGTLANSFLGNHEVFCGSDAAIMMREQRAWLFKEVDAPLLGWEVYAKKETVCEETGIVLRAGASKSTDEAAPTKPGETPPPPPPTKTTLEWALGNFLTNVNNLSAAVEDYTALFDIKDKAALAKALAEVKLQPAASYKDGYDATVTVIKAQEAIVKATRIAFSKEWFELS